jgi:quercetin dioxygenase-like cupin family protein
MAESASPSYCESLNLRSQEAPVDKHARTPDGKPVIRKDLLLAALAARKSVSRVDIKQVDLAPGQIVGRHTHPIPVVGYIVNGQILFQVAGEAATTLVSGCAFYEPADTVILHFDNASAEKPARFLAFYLMGDEDHHFIDMLPRGASVDA